MAITVEGLTKLGFTREVDFSLEDDGSGVVIKRWLSASPQPSEAEIETAHAEWKSEYDAEQVAKSDRIASAKAKLEALGLTTDEVKDAFGI